MIQSELNFDGETFDPAQDAKRLTGQWMDVWKVMSDEQWHTLADLSHFTSHPESSVSARIRDFRKERFGGHMVDRRRSKRSGGFYEYRLIANKTALIPQENGI